MSLLSTTSSKISPTAKGKQRSISSITAPERLKSALKEKDADIEELKKQRDLDRKEVAKV